VLPALLALLAAVADFTGAHGLARGALLFAIPFAAVAALAAFGRFLDVSAGSAGGLQALLWAAAVVLLVLSSAVRATAVGVPPLAESALVTALAVFVLKALVAAAPYARRLALRPAKP
jgi:hypothetical protein